MKQAELIEQAKLIRWTHKREVRALMPALAWLFHTPNGGARSKLAGAQMTALGVKKGVPDLLMPIAHGPHAGLAIEMKSSTGSTSPEQKSWLATLAEQNWSVHTCRSAEEARIVIARYFLLIPANVPAIA